MEHPINSFDSDKSPLVAIILINWNRWKDTIECLDSLQNITYLDCEIVLVDNGSRDDSLIRIQKWMLVREFGSPEEHWHENLLCKSWRPQSRQPWRKFTLIQVRENLGFCKGNNLAIRFALKGNADYVLLLNNDMVVDPQFLGHLVKTSQAKSSAGIVGGKIYNYYDRKRITHAGGKVGWYKAEKRLHDGELDSESTVGEHLSEWAPGGLALVKKEVFEKIGFLDETFFLWSEEVDFSVRARRAGFEVWVNLDSKVWHKVGSSIGTHTPIDSYYAARNRLAFHGRYASSLLDQWLYFSVFIARNLIRTTQWTLRGRFNTVIAAWAGVWDYLRGFYGKWAWHDRFARSPGNTSDQVVE